MRTLSMTSLVLTALLSVSSPVLGEEVFTADLDGDQEVPPVVTETRGRAAVHVADDATEARFWLSVVNGVRVTQAHIHCAPSGMNGPIVAFLAGFHDLGWDTNGFWTTATFTNDNIIPTGINACPSSINNIADLVAAMRNGNTYVNVHTLANPAGEVRGQLSPVGPPDLANSPD